MEFNVFAGVFLRKLNTWNLCCGVRPVACILHQLSLAYGICSTIIFSHVVIFYTASRKFEKTVRHEGWLGVEPLVEGWVGVFLQSIFTWYVVLSFQDPYTFIALARPMPFIFCTFKVSRSHPRKFSVCEWVPHVNSFKESESPTNGIKCLLPQEMTSNLTWGPPQINGFSRRPKNNHPPPASFR